jgi:hypothetical protein
MNSFQFRITLKDIKPPIWRRIIVPADYTFWDLHVAIQDAMGWSDSHLHDFNNGTYDSFHIGVPVPGGDDIYEVQPGWMIGIRDHLDCVGKTIGYLYDFGDGWQHTVKLEKIIAEETKAPRCVGGKRACPPEDCGGPGGYYDFCAIMKMKRGTEYKEMKAWFGRDYDPEAFDAGTVVFDDPRVRFKEMQDFQ